VLVLEVEQQGTLNCGWNESNQPPAATSCTETTVAPLLQSRSTGNGTNRTNADIAILVQYKCTSTVLVLLNQCWYCSTSTGTYWYSGSASVGTSTGN
jgi:hypothetical protein